MIKKHLSKNNNERDLNWIKEALQTAIELEHATLPLYLSSMFSLEVQNYTTYNLIRSVVMEEMVHMAVACNTLAILGGTPKIKGLQPKFPGFGLPGGAEPDLEVVLAKLSPKQVKNFMRLESPELLLPDEYKDENYPSIGTLYGAIKEAIINNEDEIRSVVKKVSEATPNTYANQVGDNIGFTTFKYEKEIDPITQIIEGINEIVDQGEGSKVGDLWTSEDFQGEASHFARFAEIYFEAQLQEPSPKTKLSQETLPNFFKGHKIPWPVVTNILAIPSDGYQKILDLDPNKEAVEKVLDTFDDNYTGIMNDLDAMWNGPAAESWPKFGAAVGAMTEMRVQSCFYIMRNQIPQKIIDNLSSHYPKEYNCLNTYTDLSQPVFYGPRFINKNAK